MDRCGDMVVYLQRGLEAQGYKGVLEFADGKLRMGEPWPDMDEGEITQSRAEVVMWAKDEAFRVTIELAFNVR
jgi:hypothetical protein